jgi:hypothetical protein
MVADQNSRRARKRMRLRKIETMIMVVIGM